MIECGDVGQRHEVVVHRVRPQVDEGRDRVAFSVRWIGARRDPRDLNVLATEDQKAGE